MSDAPIATTPTVVNILMPDGTIKPWNRATEPKPDSIGNQSRNGFLFNCYFHPLGRFFQNTIKAGILSVIRRIHDKEIPRYDRQAYTYEDKRLQILDKIITDAIGHTIQDADKDRKQEILNQCKDICLFMLKEDAFYRPRVLEATVRAAEQILENKDLLLSLTDYEAYNMTRFADGTNHAGDFSDLPEDERAKLPRHWIDGSVYGR